jgi:hypothetical protein
MIYEKGAKEAIQRRKRGLEAAQANAAQLLIREPDTRGLTALRSLALEHINRVLEDLDNCMRQGN